MSGTRDWITPCRDYSLQLIDEAWQQIDRECSRSRGIETGGILVGRYTEDCSTVIITEAPPPPTDSDRGSTWFHRGVAGLHTLLKSAWERKPRTHYVGEWHYHPAYIVEPSSDDLAQMYRISADPRYRCHDPVMIIAGKSSTGEERPTRSFVFPKSELFIEFHRSRRLDAP
jgi:hypothetical protein